MSSRTFTLLLAVGLLLSACDYGGGEGAPAPAGCGDPVQTAIDTGAELEIAPGEGVGVFVEYLGDGEWHVRTTCDTNQSGRGCTWDIVTWPIGGGELLDFTGEDFDPTDAVGFEYDGSLRAVVYTESDVDGLRFSATPGAALRFDALLDGYCANPYIYWVGEGAVHTGSPSNPTDFIPSQ